MSKEMPYGRHAFPPTRWSLVARATQTTTVAKRKALNELLELYHPVLKQHLVRSMAVKPERADDLVQGFVAEKVLAKNVLTLADRGKGRFRSFLLKVFTNYVLGELRRDHARKRGPSDSKVASLDEDPDMVSVQDHAADAFNVAWARQVLAQTVARMRKECEEKARADIWGLFDARLLGPALEQAQVLAYEELVTQFGLQSPSQASNLLITAKRMFQRILTDVVRDTVARTCDVEEEIRDLRSILSHAHAGLKERMRSSP